MKILTPALAILFFILPSISSAAALTTQQSTSLIAVVQSSPGTPASAFVNLITAFSNITVNQASSLIAVVQASPSTPATAFVNLLVSFTEDTPAVQTTTPATTVPAVTTPVAQDNQQPTQPVTTQPPTPTNSQSTTPTPTQVTPPSTTVVTPTQTQSVPPTAVATPTPQLKIAITSDKTQIRADGQDTATITVKVTNPDGTPVKDKTVFESSPKNQTFTTDSSGTVIFTVATTQAANFTANVIVDGKNYGIEIKAINTTGNVSGSVTFTGNVRDSAPGAVRAPASDQILAFFVANSIDSSITGLKMKSIRIKLVNLDQTWFKNVRLTDSPPCTQGRFCTYQTIAGPASYNLGSDGILTITPSTPIDVYQGKTIYVIADMTATLNTSYGTDKPMLTYQISLPDYSSIEFAGKVNGYEINTIKLNLKTEWNQNGITPVTATVNSNTCMSSGGQPVACY